MTIPDIQTLWNIGSGIVVGSSVLINVLPPVEAFDEYPKFQGTYKFLFIFLKRFCSLDLRTIIYPQLKQNQTGGNK